MKNSILTLAIICMVLTGTAIQSQAGNKIKTPFSFVCHEDQLRGGWLEFSIFYTCRSGGTIYLPTRVAGMRVGQFGPNGNRYSKHLVVRVKKDFMERKGRVYIVNLYAESDARFEYVGWAVKE